MHFQKSELEQKFTSLLDVERTTYNRIDHFIALYDSPFLCRSAVFHQTQTISFPFLNLW